MSVQESSHDQMIGVFVLGNFDNVPNVTCGYLSIPKLCMRDTNFKIIVDFFCKCNFWAIKIDVFRGLFSVAY